MIARALVTVIPMSHAKPLIDIVAQIAQVRSYVSQVAPEHVKPFVEALVTNLELLEIGIPGLSGHRSHYVTLYMREDDRRQGARALSAFR